MFEFLIHLTLFYIRVKLNATKLRVNLNLITDDRTILYV